MYVRRASPLALVELAATLCTVERSFNITHIPNVFINPSYRDLSSLYAVD